MSQEVKHGKFGVARRLGRPLIFKTHVSEYIDDGIKERREEEEEEGLHMPTRLGMRIWRCGWTAGHGVEGTSTCSSGNVGDGDDSIAAKCLLYSNEDDDDGSGDGGDWTAARESMVEAINRCCC